MALPRGYRGKCRAFADMWLKHHADGGTTTGLAKQLEVNERGLYARRERVEKELGIKLPTHIGSAVAQARVKSKEILEALQGHAPEHDMVHTVPRGFSVRGVSTLYNDKGEVSSQWVKSRQDPAARELLLEEAVAAFAEEIPRTEPTKAPEHVVSELLNAYVVTDFHLGMLAWGEETGADWDITIAENMLVDWFSQAIAGAPNAKVAIFAQLGDFLHWDGMDAVTPQSKHLLDADTRFQKLVRVAIRSIRRVIGMLLEKHERVHVIMAEGNHDTASSIWLREWFSALYENEPRITVDRSPNPYYAYEHGLTSLFFHHGHLRKVTSVDTVFASKFSEMFGRTKFRYAHTGHLHHVDVKETNLMIVEQHRTLAAHDAYAARGGWLAGRDAQVITYSSRFGEVGRNKVSSKMVEAA